MIGFATMILLLPLSLIHYYPISKEMDFFLIFPYFWNKLLMHTSNLNWIVSSLIVLVGSYAFGFIFMGFYDLIGLHIIRRSSRLFARLSHPWKRNRIRGWYYWENKIKPFSKDKTKNESTKYAIGSIEYAELMCWLNKPENTHFRDYYYWEFIKTVSCEYLGLLVFVFFTISTLVYLPIQWWQDFIRSNLLNTNIILRGTIYSWFFIVLLFIFYLFLLYGQAFYQCAYHTAFRYIISEYEKNTDKSDDDADESNPPYSTHIIPHPSGSTI